jgi:hypothetical protein
MNLSVGGTGIHIALLAPRAFSGAVVLLLDGQEVWRSVVSLVPGVPFRSGVATADDAPPIARLTLRLEDLSGVVQAEYDAEFKLK